MAFAQVRGVRLHYEVFGDQGPWFALTTGGHNEDLSPEARNARPFSRLLPQRQAAATKPTTRGGAA